MTDVDAGYGADEEYQPGIPLPRIDLSGGVRRVAERVFGGWRPDLRAVAVVLLVIYGVGLAGSLLTIDYSVSNLAFWLGGSGRLAPQATALDITAAVARLLSTPVDLLIAAGAVLLLLRRSWGRRLALAGLALLVVEDLVQPVVTLAHARGVALRADLTGFVYVLVPLALAAVLLWSRMPEGDA